MESRGRGRGMAAMPSSNPNRHRNRSLTESMYIVILIQESRNILPKENITNIDITKE